MPDTTFSSCIFKLYYRKCSASVFPLLSVVLEGFSSLCSVFGSGFPELTRGKESAAAVVAVLFLPSLFFPSISAGNCAETGDIDAETETD